MKRRVYEAYANTADGVGGMLGLAPNGVDALAAIDLDGPVRRFSNGSTADGDVVIGADGIRSTVRSVIDPTAPPTRYTGLLGFGGRAIDVDIPSTEANCQT